jgi:2-dehydropantoate 2-reductase
MRICVFGAGSLGSAIGGLLSVRNKVTLVGRRDHVRAVLKKGLRLTGDIRRVVRVDAAEHVGDLAPPELLLITTKAYDTEEAIAACRGWARESTLALTLQNGLGNLELLRKWKGGMAMGGTTTLGATLTSPGVVRVSGFGKTLIGSDSNPHAAEEVASIFSSCGIPASMTRDVYREIWAKTLISACINPTTAILRVPNGAVLRNPAVKRLLDAICAEGALVARASGVDLDVRRLQARVRAVARDTARNTSSMLQDVELGRRTEISQINGAIYALGERLEIPCPLNLALSSIVESLESNPRTQKG